MKLRKFFVLFIFIFLLFDFSFIPSFSAEKDSFTGWNLKRFDNANTAFTTAYFPDDMEFDDFLPIHSYHAPIVANNCIFLVEAITGIVHCFCIETQELIWKKQYSEVLYEELRVGNTCCFSEQTNQLILLETVKGLWDKRWGFVSKLYAINPENGDVNWEYEIHGYYSNSITLDENFVFAKVIQICWKNQDSNYLSIGHILYCLNVKTGELQWSSFLPGGEAYWDENPPAITEHYIITTSSTCVSYDEKEGFIFQQTPCFITVVNKENGKILQEISLDQYIGSSSPLIDGNKVFVVVNESDYNVADRAHHIVNVLLCFDLMDHKLQLTNEIVLSDEAHGFLYNVHLSKHNNKLYFLDYSGLLVCISSIDNTILWQKKVGEQSWCGPYFCNNDYLIICTRNLVSEKKTKDAYEINLQYIDPENGTVLFNNAVPYEGSAPKELVGTDNHIWAIGGGQIAHFTPAIPPSLRVSPEEIHETCIEGNSDDIQKVITIESKGKIEGTIESDVDWISLSTHKMNKLTKTIQVTLDPSGMEPGEHGAHIRFTTNGGNVTVPVTVEILKLPRLEIVPAKVEMEILYDSVPDDSVFTISNSGGDGVEGVIESKESWITLSNTTIDDTTLSFTATYTMDTKVAGSYAGTIIVRYNNGVISIPVNIIVTPNPTLTVVPNTIVKQVALGACDSVEVQLMNQGGIGLMGDVSSNAEWLIPSRNKYNDETTTMEFHLNAINLKAGTYHGMITFAGNDQMVEVPVTLQCIVWIQFQIGSTTVEVNKVKETISSPPYLFEARSYVPIRRLVESIPVLNYLKDAEMDWDSEEEKVTIRVHEKLIELWIDQPIAHINGEPVSIDSTNEKVCPQIKNGRTFLPLRFTAENLGYQVEWDAPSQTIHLKYIVQ
jgi:outer membrane protein assembly factor BamB